MESRVSSVRDEYVARAANEKVSRRGNAVCQGDDGAKNAMNSFSSFSVSADSFSRRVSRLLRVFNENKSKSHRFSPSRSRLALGLGGICSALKRRQGKHETSITLARSAADINLTQFFFLLLNKYSCLSYFFFLFHQLRVPVSRSLVFFRHIFIRFHRQSAFCLRSPPCNHSLVHFFRFSAFFARVSRLAHKFIFTASQPSVVKMYYVA